MEGRILGENYGMWACAGCDTEGGGVHWDLPPPSYTCSSSPTPTRNHKEACDYPICDYRWSETFTVVARLGNINYENAWHKSDLSGFEYVAHKWSLFMNNSLHWNFSFFPPPPPDYKHSIGRLERESIGMLRSTSWNMYSNNTRKTDPSKVCASIIIIHTCKRKRKRSNNQPISIQLEIKTGNEISMY